MREPNFGEGQVQQSVNSSIQFEIFKRIGSQVSAKVPTLLREHSLGWDTGFYFHWLSYQGLAGHDGCNLFIQYKLSKELTSRGAAQYESWGTPYMRFRIPYRDGGSNDYTQWNRLKLLADQGYPTFYATNSVLELSVLEKLEQNGQLLDEAPFLDVRRIRDLHVYATFTRSSSHFVLHSEKEIVEECSWSMVAEKLLGEKKSSLDVGNNELLAVLKLLGEKFKSKYHAQLVENYPVLTDEQNDIRRSETLIRQFNYLRFAFHRLYGISVHRFLY